MKNSKNIITIVVLIAIIAMAVAYSAFATQLNINGQSEIVGEWNIKITGISVENISTGCDAGTPEYTNTSATFSAKLLKPGDTITYLITIQNGGTINAVLDNVTFTPDNENGSPAISYETTTPATNLGAGEQTTFTVKVTYNAETTEIPSVKTKTITGIIEYVQDD